MEMSSFWISPSVLLLGLLCGCGGPPVGVIDGKVTDGDTPVHPARLVITPKSGDGRSYRAETVSKDGTYRLATIAKKGMPTGEYDVVITYHTLPDGGSLPEGEQGMQMVYGGQAKKHRVQMPLTLEEGESTIDFDIAQGIIAEQ